MMPYRFIYRLTINYFFYLFSGFLLLVGQPGPAQPASGIKPLSGFNEQQAIAQYKLENLFDTELKASNLHDWMKRLTARPHHVGSPYDRENAAFIASLFKSWGYDTRIDTAWVLFPTPKLRQLQLIAPTRFTASLTEAPLKEDPVSQQTREQLPTYNCYSPNGDVTAEVVFVNYGLPIDYEQLKLRGVDVTGKIVLVKYGNSWRGIKPKVAAEQGAIGCLIYSDPKDDGYAQGEMYPKGAFKNETMVQRGSVMDMPIHAGDPLTPGYGSVKTAKRLDRSVAPALLKIPVLPISYADALPLLKALGGPMAPEAWRGGLPISYHLGLSPAKVHLKLEFNWNIEPVYSVIAMLKGSDYPDQWIMRGNHHDAWVNGAYDPISGMVAVLEEARAISELAKTGWKPKRTLVFAAWDGEEAALLGSTEWVETNESIIKKNVVAYFNSDVNGRGFLYAGGSHTLQKFFNQVGRDVIDPQKGIPVIERQRAFGLLTDYIPGTTSQGDMPIFALGSGSDFSPFLQHASIASMNIGFGGEDNGGEYHSIYDSYDHFIRFKDPDFAYGITLAKVMGRCVLRMADADILPFDFQGFSTTVALYAGEVKKLAETMRTETERQNRLIADKRYEAMADPKETFITPVPKEAVPFLNFAPLDNAVTKLAQSVLAYEQARSGNPALSVEQKAELNQLLYQSERHLLNEQGLPRRPWYKHQIYAPGMYTGYDVKTLPGIREAIEERKWIEAGEQIQVTSATLDQFSAQIDRALVLMTSVTDK